MHSILYKDDCLCISFHISNNIIIIPKKFISLAVSRNLMKRRIRFLVKNFIILTNRYISFKILCKKLYYYTWNEYVRIIDIIHKNARKYTMHQGRSKR